MECMPSSRIPCSVSSILYDSDDSFSELSSGRGSPKAMPLRPGGTRHFTAKLPNRAPPESQLLPVDPVDPQTAARCAERLAAGDISPGRATRLGRGRGGAGSGHSMSRKAASGPSHAQTVAAMTEHLGKLKRCLGQLNDGCKALEHAAMQCRRPPGHYTDRCRRLAAEHANLMRDVAGHLAGYSVEHSTVPPAGFPDQASPAREEEAEPATSAASLLLPAAMALAKSSTLETDEAMEGLPRAENSQAASPPLRYFNHPSPRTRGDLRVRL
eukprot:TRINITY_DN20825_c0_g1_i2.p1 TRINITY_DN20825_c0_g1~~TRINITY_DN20825_c0_g1_i2.p1  ORF type:complete len:270 (+),score=39.25 TRINITY_DN20825_c0_g1_i2:226-1035(+)